MDLACIIIDALFRNPPYPSTAKTATRELDVDYIEKLFDLLESIKELAAYHKLGYRFIRAIAKIYADYAWHNQDPSDGIQTLVIVPTGDLLKDLQLLMQEIPAGDIGTFMCILQLLDVHWINEKIPEMKAAIEMVINGNPVYRTELRMLFMRSLKHMTDSQRRSEFRKLWPEFGDYPKEVTEHILKVVGDVIPVDKYDITKTNELYDAIVRVHRIIC